MKSILLAFAALSIIGQIQHAYWMFDYVSNLKTDTRIFGKVVNQRQLQTVVNCIIIANAILFLILLNMHNWAIAAVVTEALINCYYVFCSYEEKYKEFDLRTKQSRDMLKEKRMKLIGAYFVSLLIPVCIYIFTYLYTIA